MGHVKPLYLGNLKLKSNVWYAPLAGCSDYPFRQMSALFNPGLMFCEMVKMDALVRCDENTFRLLDFNKDMHHIGGQLVGSKPELAGACARIIEDLGFDVIDLNCGCPVDKVTKDGSGSGLLKTPNKIGEILSNMVAAVNIPVTVKIRCGWDSETINAPLITEIAEQAGAKAITIHGRTRVQGYKGPAERNHIADCKAVAKNIHVIGNGDVLDGPSALSFFEQTGCDGVLCARGTMGKPWIAQDIYRADEGLPPLSFSGEEYYNLLKQHIDYILAYGNEKKALIDLRRVACWYLKNGHGVKILRTEINRSKDVESAIHAIDTYDWSQSRYAEFANT